MNPWGVARVTLMIEQIHGGHNEAHGPRIRQPCNRPRGCDHGLPMTMPSLPAELGYHMPAEWEPHAATWLSWPRREGISFPTSFDRVLPTLRAMVEALIGSEQVCINVCNGAHEAEACEVLCDLPMERVTFYRVPTNEPWCRDHG